MIISNPQIDAKALPAAHKQYRRDIDGLRALAIVPVILFHAGFDLIPGGYIGVDVFFVISGFLITRIVYREITANKFTISGFYARRFRRILPALFVVTLATIPVAWAIFTPRLMDDFAKNVIATSTFTSNILASLQTGYFDVEASAKPLLHMWSLAVEEQFYIFFPILLILLWRISHKYLLIILGVIALVSLVLAQFGSENFPVQNYFLLPSRIWELIFGSIVAIALDQTKLSKFNEKKLRFLLPLALSGVVLPMFFFTSLTPYPSLWTLIPVFSAGILIAFGDTPGFINKVLSLRVLVWIGLISFSAYLWHQPVLILGNSFLSAHQGMSWLVGWFPYLGMVLVLILSFLTYKFVETPFRTKIGIHFSAKKVVYIGLFSSFLLALVGFLLLINPVNTRMQLVHPKVVQAESVNNSTVQGRTCPDFTGIPEQTDCSIFGTEGPLTIIWGDSHAFRLLASLPSTWIEEGHQIMILWNAGCPPIDAVFREDTEGSGCVNPRFLHEQMNYVLDSHPQKVFLVARWSMYVNGWQKLNQMQDRNHFLMDTFTQTPNKSTSKSVLYKHLLSTVNRLASKTEVFLVTQFPDMQHLSETERLTKPDTPSQPVLSWQSVSDNIIKEISEKTGAQVIKLSPLFCNADVCSLRIGEDLLYEDDNHASPKALSIIWDAILKISK